MSFEKNNIYTKNGIEYTFSYNINISTVDKVKFVNTVTGYLVGNNFNFIAKDLFFDFGLISIFTDYDVSYIYDSNNSISEIEQLLNETNIAEIVKADMADSLLAELHEAVDLNIEYKTGIHKDIIKDEIAQILKLVESKMQEVDIKALVEFAGVFSKYAKNFTPTEIINAYEKSDVFKKHTRKIEEKKRQEFENTINKIKQNQQLKILNTSK